MKHELALFAGVGGGILGGRLLGWRTVCAVEIDPFCREVLLRRQLDRYLPRFPIWDDVRTFDGKPWKGIVDVISGGFPCQDISAAGKGAGISGDKSGLWTEYARIIREVQPKYAFVENSPMLIVRGLPRILGDLAEMGYDARWGVFSACSIGASHSRERLFIVAYPVGLGLQKRLPIGKAQKITSFRDCRKNTAWDIGFKPKTESLIHRGTNDMAYRMDRIKAIGNGQVPKVAEVAWRLLSE